MSDLIVEALGLRKRYADIVAVDGIDLTLERGHVYGLLGPNGSGKSTTVRMLLGLAAPDDGSVRLFGEPLHGHEPRLLRRVGSVVETPAFLPYLCGRDNLRLLDVYTPGAGPEAIEDVLRRVHLEGIFTGLLDSASGWLSHVPEALLAANASAVMKANGVLTGGDTGGPFSGAASSGGPSEWRGAAVLALYIVAFGAVSFWRFSRRDIQE